jgi:ketosteroid isomerase-like protein
MNVLDPAQLNDCYNDLFRRRALGELLGLYEADAVLYGPNGASYAGRAKIRERIEMLMSLSGDLAATQLSCVVHANLALLHASSTFRGKDSAGRAIDIGGQSTKLALCYGYAIGLGEHSVLVSTGADWR